MPEKKEYVQTPFKAFITSPRRMLYAIAFFLVFALTTSQLGLVSQQLHNGGNDYANYPGMEYKHDLGLLLFSCVFTYLYLIGHLYSAGLGLITFFTFVGAVFWGTGAGVMFQVSPFRSYNCGNPADSFSPNWARFADQCSRIVAIQGIAWANWGLFVFLFFGMLIHKLEIRPRPNVTFYGP
ncbi:hypothetical protein ARMGADRAFT_1080902 [Armillaria gallica]|uniref:MARVEL domain-containing protein n=1 Tax=Armillaria gallica TaxID=47427 RepID=A0A2H3DA31_ARMGA|nr:hypothetical protein EDD85DRAFT_851736 [Armillaria nabsnona]PBK92105.1 hypothetical protein ARMGADRAFT_1080902 [Armillaria gallica]